MRRAGVGIVVFARPAVAGLSKTRLAPRLGVHRAARLHARLVERTVRMAAATGACVEMHLASERRGAEFGALRRRYAFTTHRQRGEDLGERMRRSFEGALHRYSIVVLIGTDCPPLSARHVDRAVRALAGGRDAAFAPAEDGGYGLIALRRNAVSLFTGIAWGTGSVYRDTLAKAAALSWRTVDVGLVWDVDRPADLDRYLGASWRFESCTAPMNSSLRPGHLCPDCAASRRCVSRRRPIRGMPRRSASTRCRARCAPCSG